MWRTQRAINGPVWALVAFDSHDYEIPTAPEGSVQVTREALIDTILAAQLADGGWNVSSSATTSDVDMTAMAIQALAPYYNSETKATANEVKTAVDKALVYLSKVQNADGSYSSVDSVTSESCAQVIVALSALGIDADKDARFIKNGRFVVDALCDFYVEGGGFKHVLDGEIDGMATEQGYYALAAYDRFKAGETSLYDMSDVTIEPSKPGEDEPSKPDDDKTPTTGDGANVLLWMVLMVFAMTAAVGTSVYAGKRKMK